MVYGYMHNLLIRIMFQPLGIPVDVFLFKIMIHIEFQFSNFFNPIEVLFLSWRMCGQVVNILKVLALLLILFLSEFWQHHFQLQGVYLRLSFNLSSAYHPMMGK